MRRLVSQILPVVLAILSAAGTGLSQQSQTQDKVVAYLDSYLKTHAERPGSLRNHFNEFLSVPSNLESSLRAAFPKHRFYVAQTLYTHWRPDDGDANILVVTDEASGDVIGHKWAIWFSNGTESFNDILMAYQAQTPEDALERVRVLSELIVSLNNSELGRVQIKDRLITAELGGRQDPWRILKVKIDKRNRFGRMAFINPKNGEET